MDVLAKFVMEAAAAAGRNDTCQIWTGVGDVLGG